MSDRQLSTGQGLTDYTLLLQRLEQAVLEESALPKCRRVLVKQEIWGRLDPDQAMQWARIAQIAGCVDTALEIYKYLTAQNPAFDAPWQAWLELLDILDRRKDLAALCQRASVHLGRDKVFSRLRPDNPVKGTAAEASGTGESDPGLDAWAAPFAQMHERQQRVKGFMDLFFSRTDLFARQWADRQKNTSGYVPVRRPVTCEDMEDHFKGTRTYGFYLMNTDATVKCAVIDADLVSGLRGAAGRDLARSRTRIRKDRAYMAARINEGAAEFGLSPVIEFSGGKGYHFWFFMASPVPAAQIRQALGFLPAGKTLLHYLFSTTRDYNPHLVDYKLSRVKGPPLGCRRIHSLTGYDRDYCRIEPDAAGYLHPLIHLKSWAGLASDHCVKSEKIENLTDAVENMKTAIVQLETFLT